MEVRGLYSVYSMITSTFCIDRLTLILRLWWFVFQMDRTKKDKERENEKEKTALSKVLKKRQSLPSMRHRLDPR